MNNLILARGSPMEELIGICLDAFCAPSKLIPTSSSGESSDDSLRGCGKPVLDLIQRLRCSIRGQSGDFDLILQRLEDMIALANEKFYAFPFKDVPACWRDLFREASLLKFSALAVQHQWGQNKQKASSNVPLSTTRLDEMVRAIDMALIMAGPFRSETRQDSIGKVLNILQEISLSSTLKHVEVHSNKRQKIEDEAPVWEDRFPASATSFALTSHPISRRCLPTFEEFEKHTWSPLDPDLGPEPLIITGALNHWPARNERPWSSPSYLMSRTIGGRRLVPIELGRSYVDEGWGQKIITFKEFIDLYICNPDSHGLATGYLAQHNLFTQIPLLRQDIAIPDY